jgi:hypothetical protein
LVAIPLRGRMPRLSSRNWAPETESMTPRKVTAKKLFQPSLDRAANPLQVIEMSYT